jgi:hypothetical protein
VTTFGEKKRPNCWIKITPNAENYRPNGEISPNLVTLVAADRDSNDFSQKTWVKRVKKLAPKIVMRV